MVKKYVVESLSLSQTKQKGVVLVVSLVFLVALTAVAAALMQNTTTDMKMAGASQEKAIAVQETISEMDRVIYNEINRVNLSDEGGNINRFAQTIINPIALTVTQSSITTGTLVGSNAQNSVIPCERAIRGSEGECNTLRITINRTYGRNNNSNVQVNAGIAQQLLTN